MGRLKHLQQGLRSFGHLPNTKISRSNDVYGFGGAEYWWDAAIGLNTSTDLGAVSFWVDRISNARWVQGTAGNQPRLKLTSGLNASYPSIDLYDSARRMTFGISTGFNINNKTIAFVCKINSINTVNVFISPTSDIRYIAMAGTSALITGIGSYTSLATQIATNIENTNNHIVVMNSTSVVIDGVIQATGTSTFPFAITTLGNLGGAIDNQYGLIGEVGELLIYNRNLTNAQGVELCNNLNAKWAIY